MTIVFKVSDNVKEKMIKYYNDLRRDKTPPYPIFDTCSKKSYTRSHKS